LNTSDFESEFQRIEGIGLNSQYSKGLNGKVVKFAFQEVAPLLKGSILELGPAEGLMTEEIVKAGYIPELLEGSFTLSQNLIAKYPQLLVRNCLFEEFESDSQYDLIIMGHVLEHVVDPVGILKKFAKLLSPNGIIWAAVPNANSIHRLAAVEMGMLSSIFELNEADVTHGHRRVFSLPELLEVFKTSGLETVEHGGYWLKPLSNGQIESQWTDEMIKAFMALGRKFPELAAEIYITAKNGQQEINERHE
jgi:2-polyprenyl-3-methyl-5-hydroxy-6-metoxy-1,4-benzoquinol methylase